MGQLLIQFALQNADSAAPRSVNGLSNRALPICEVYTCPITNVKRIPDLCCGEMRPRYYQV
jgi:hypothetical protein